MLVFFSHHPKGNSLLVTSRKVQLGDEQKQCYVEVKMPRVLGTIQSWNNSHPVTFYLNGLITDIPDPVSLPMN